MNYNLKTFRPGWINNRLKKIARQSHDDRTKDDEELDLTLECCTVMPLGWARWALAHPEFGIQLTLF